MLGVLSSSNLHEVLGPLVVLYSSQTLWSCDLNLYSKWLSLPEVELQVIVKQLRIRLACVLVVTSSRESNDKQNWRAHFLFEDVECQVMRKQHELRCTMQYSWQKAEKGMTNKTKMLLPVRDNSNSAQKQRIMRCWIPVDQKTALHQMHSCVSHGKK